MQKKQIILIHAVFWFVMLFFIGLETIPSVGKITYNIIAADYFLYAFSFIVFFYLFYLFISKKHLDKKGIRNIIIFGLLFVIAITIPITFIYISFLAKEVFDLNGKTFLITTTKYYLSFLETNFLFALSGALLKISLLRYENIMKQKEAEKQLVKGELALLKSQMNPQFLLNTLSEIKSLIEQTPEKAVYSVEKLSEIMSYMLYETSTEKVFLDDEINYINNYLELHNIRLKNGGIDFKIIGDTKGVMIPPLIFMPLIENAFRYADVIENNPGITVRLLKNNKDLIFSVTISNCRIPVKDISEDNPEEKSIKRRLDLLFGDKYKLEIDRESKSYKINLIIELPPS